jgi:hypothetical protein
MTCRRALSSALFLIVTAPTGRIAAQGDDAEGLFNRGLADMQAGLYEAGCPTLRRSYDIDHSPGTLFTLAECEAKQGKVASAAADYESYLALYASMPPSRQARHRERATIAEAKRAALERDAPKLTLVLPPGAPSGTEVRRDGRAYAAADIGAALPVDPGEHVVTTQAPGGSVTELHVILRNAETKQLTLEVKAPPGGTGPDAKRVGVYVAGGIGLAGLVLGSIAGGISLGKQGTIHQDCTNQPGSNISTCKSPEGVAAGNSAKTLDRVSDVGFGVGLAGLGTALALFLVSRSQRDASAAHPAVLSAGQAGAALGVQGGW